MQKGDKGFFYWVKLLCVAALLILGIIYLKQIWGVLKYIYGIILPFLVGGIIAFVLNIPMSAIEKALFGKTKKKFFLAIKRPVSMMLTIIFVLLLAAILGFAVVPQVVETFSELAKKIPSFYRQTIDAVENWLKAYPDVQKMLADELKNLEEVKIDWTKVLEQVKEFFMNGIGGSFIKGTFSIAGKIGGGVVNAAISVIFSVYILAQKEKLASQCKRILKAYLPEKANENILKVAGMLQKNFSNFIAGQCLEAVILGTLTAIALLIFQFDYVMIIGVLIAFSALIPVVGGFIGCGVGVLLFMIDDPIKALWFIVLFVVVQLIEGNFIYPYVVGNSVGLPSIWVLAAITIGGSLMGIGGMLFFIPLTSTCYALIRENVNARNAAKGLVVESPQEDVNADKLKLFGKRTQVKKRTSKRKR